MAAAIVSHCEMYKWPYLQNRSTDIYKIGGKMFISPTTDMKMNLCDRFRNTHHDTKDQDMRMTLVKHIPS